MEKNDWKAYPVENFSDYEVNKNGVVRNKITGKEIKRYRRCQYAGVKNKDWYVTMKGKNRSYTYQKVISILATTFLGMPHGMVAYTKDGNPNHLSLDNILFGRPDSNTKQPTQCNFHQKTAVLKIDKRGKTIKEYASIKETAKAEFICESGIIRQCNGKAKNTYDGFSFCYKGDKESYERSLYRFEHHSDLRRNRKCK